jgi:hypothetical protein
MTSYSLDQDNPIQEQYIYYNTSQHAIGNAHTVINTEVSTLNYT